ncbi:uncharacterized protein LOC135467849 [Liolophura sinensis]|uniref:uncharacterized protein LOC135467849 n=1 Tax=Liolophura sinensis TaxID=3198878 RepID=UPI0031584C34
MNHIVVRTNAGEYHPGDTVYGAVYLNIVNPTAGCGVRLKFRGYEYFAYGLGHGKGNDFPLFSDKKDYIDCNDIILYKNASPLSLGSYVFPFQFSLLHEIPGSFNADGGEDVRWEALVEYWVQTELIGAESVQAKQSLIVYQKTPNLQQAQVAHHKVKCWFGLSQKNFSLTARLLDPVHKCLGYANLRLLIANQSSENVVSLTIKLNRELLLCTKYSSTTPLLNDPNIVRMDRKLWIQPEQESLTIWEHSICEDHGGILNRGMDKIRIPLFTNNREAIPPTTHGAHVQCRYKVVATVQLQNGQSCSVTVPVNSILPVGNRDWKFSELPEWINNKLTVMATLPPFCVQSHILYGEPFSGLPPFQQL